MASYAHASFTNPPPEIPGTVLKKEVSIGAIATPFTADDVLNKVAEVVRNGLPVILEFA